MRQIRRALVSGVTGFVGAALASRLIQDGCEVYGLVRPHSDDRRIRSLAGLRRVVHDESAGDSLRGIVKSARPDVVFHMAAYGVQSGAADVDEMIRGNLEFTTRLLRATADVSDCRFIHTGSCFEYGRVNTPRPIQEDDPARPFSLYGATKFASVETVRTVAPRIGVPAAVLRPFAVYGPGEAAGRLVPSLIAALEDGRSVDLTPGEQARDWIYIDDVVDAYTAVAGLSTDQFRGSPFNVCTAVPTTVRRLGETLTALAGVKAQLLRWGRLPYRAEEPMWIVGDNRRLQTTANWRPQFSLEQGLQRCLDAIRRGAAAGVSHLSPSSAAA
jgi:nucleoside-diphosphate-sugar epimerase